jgi:hypothetical protein
MRTDVISASHEPVDLAGELRRAAMQRIAWLKLLPLAIPVGAGIFSVSGMGLLLLKGSAVIDYREAFVNWRMLFILACMVIIIYATHYCYVKALRICIDYYKGNITLLRQVVLTTMSDSAAIRLAGSIGVGSDGIINPARLLADIERNYYQECRSHNIALLPRELISIRNSRPIIVSLIVIGTFYIWNEIRRQFDPVLMPQYMHLAVWQWTITALLYLGQTVLLAIGIALPIVVAVAYGARRIAFLRVFVEDDGSIQVLRGPSTGE